MKTQQSRLKGQICRRLRLERGWPQQYVAGAIKSSQSQISAYELGDPNVLSRDKVKALEKLFDADLDKLAAAQIQNAPKTRFCSNALCPTNMPYALGGQQIVVRPAFVRSNELYCRACGDVLVSECPYCAAPIHRGMNCASCSKPYVEPSGEPDPDADLEAWAAERRRRNRELLDFPEPKELTGNAEDSGAINEASGFDVKEGR